MPEVDKGCSQYFYINMKFREKDLENDNGNPVNIGNIYSYSKTFAG